MWIKRQQSIWFFGVAAGSGLPLQQTTRAVQLSDGQRVGLTSDELVEVARLAASEFTVVSASVTAYDPAIDTAGAIPPAIARAVEALLTR